LQNKSALIEDTAWAIIKQLDYELWKELKADDDGVVDSVIEMLEDLIVAVEDEEIDDDEN
jgi:hypothetical protein